MKSRKAYRPAAVEGLETRVVLSGGLPAFRGTSVLLQSLHPRASRIGPRGTQSVVALTNVAFDLFKADYARARATYLAALNDLPAADTNAAAPARNAFLNYTSTRVDLLAQQVISNVLQSPATSTKQRGNAPSVQTLVSNNINGRDRDQANVANLGFRPRTLGAALIASTPTANGGTAVSDLASAAQDQAIETARVGTLNGLTIMRNGDFGNKTLGR